MSVIERLLALASQKPAEPTGPPRPLTLQERLEVIAKAKPQDPEEKARDESLIKDLNARNEAEGTYGIPITKAPAKQAGIVPPVSNAEAAAALFRGLGTSVLHGVLSPVSSFVPGWKGIGESMEADRATTERFLQQPSMGMPGFSPTGSKVLSYAPQIAGEFAGMAVPGVGLVKTSNAVWKVGKAGSGVKQMIGAEASAGGMFSVFAEADSGEDRVLNVVRDATIGGAAGKAFHYVQAAHGAIRTEIKGGKTLDKIVDEIASRTGQNTEAVESKLATMRAGLHTDTETAQTVVHVTKGTPAEKSPLGVMAQKMVENFNMRSPNFWTGRADLPGNAGVTVKWRVDGVDQVSTFKSDPTGADKGLYVRSVQNWLQSIEASQKMGHQIEVLGATYSTKANGAPSAFLNLLEGKRGQAKKKVPGAPPGTVAHAGHVPTAGETVNVRVPGGGTVSGTVLEVGGSTEMMPGSTRVYRENGKWVVLQSTGEKETFDTAIEATRRANVIYEKNAPPATPEGQKWTDLTPAPAASEGQVWPTLEKGAPEPGSLASATQNYKVERGIGGTMHLTGPKGEDLGEFPTRIEALRRARQHDLEQARAADYTVTEECKSPCKFRVRTKNGEILEDFDNSKDATEYARSIAGKGEVIYTSRIEVPEGTPLRGGGAPPVAGAKPDRAEFVVSRRASAGGKWKGVGTWEVKNAQGEVVKQFKGLGPEEAVKYAERTAAGKPVTVITGEGTTTSMGVGAGRREYYWNARGDRVDASGNVLGVKRPPRAEPKEGVPPGTIAETPYRSRLMQGEEPSLAERMQGREMVPRTMAHLEQGVPQELKPYITQDQFSVMDWGKRISLAEQHGLPELAEQLRQQARSGEAKIGKVAGEAVTRRHAEITGEQPLPRSLEGQLQPGYVRLEVGGKEIVAPFTDVNVQLAKGRPVFNLTAHRSGKERRFTVDLRAGNIETEALDQPGGYWRSDEFSNADPSSDYEHQLMRGFAHRDGSATLSATPVVLQEVESQTGKRTNIGPLDTVQAGRAEPSEFGAYRQSFGGKTAAGDLAPANEGEYYSGKFTAGFEPYKQRLRTRAQGADEEIFDAAGIENRSIVYDENVPIEDLDPSARRKVSFLHGEQLDRTQRPDVKYKDPNTGRWTLGDPTRRVSTLRSYEIFGKNQGDNVNMVQFRLAARRMIAAGVPETTPVRLRVSHHTHAPGKMKPTMTLGEVANYDLGWASPSTLQREAQRRGYRVVKDPGAGTWTVESLDDGQKQVFAHPMEALDALARIPITRNNVKLEGELERAWNMGRDRGRDPDVDAKIFLPAKAVDQAFQEVVVAGRPGMEMYVKPGREQVGAAQVSRERGARGLTEAQVSVATPATRIQAILDSLAEKAPQMRDLRVWAAEGLVNGRQKLFVYDQRKVGQLLAQFEQGFGAFGVEVRGKPITEVLQQIDEKIPDGLDILKGRDPSDAFMYSWYKSKSLKEEFMRGKLLEDSQGKYRVFTPEEKRARFAKLPTC
jgi:hypothetical protein